MVHKATPRTTDISTINTAPMTPKKVGSAANTSVSAYYGGNSLKIEQINPEETPQKQ